MLLKSLALGCLVLSLAACGHTDKPVAHKPSPSATDDRPHGTPTPAETFPAPKYVDTEDYSGGGEYLHRFDVVSTYNGSDNAIMPGTWVLSASHLGKGCEWKLTNVGPYPDYDKTAVGGFVAPGEQTTLQIKHLSGGEDEFSLLGRCEMKWTGA